MKFTQSLKKNYQFRYVYNRGKSLANRYIVVYIKKNNSAENRLGISVSKKVGNSVVRSRVTRLVRESYRLMEDGLCCGYDIVVIARASANGASYAQIDTALRLLLKKHGLIARVNIEAAKN